MLYFLIFIEGFIGLAYQMLFMRQITPEVGTSATTSSWVIGFFLLALAMGYKKGGVVVEFPMNYLGRNFVKASLVGGIGASSAFVMMFFTGLNDLLGLPVLLILAIYSMLCVAPVAYWMGQSLPLLIQCSKWGEKTSEISGNALYLSTLGSFAGAILTTNIFLLYFGATWTLALVSILAIVTGVLISKRKSTLFFALVPVVLINIGFSFAYQLHSTPFADVYVRDTDDGKVLIANNAIMSRLKDGVSASWYIHQFESLVEKRSSLGKQKILILGAGGFVSHLNDKSNEYTYVDIDPKLKEISENEFLGSRIEHAFVKMDARRFLIDSNETYDIVLLDAFSSRKAIPPHLTTKEFMALLKTKINNQGVLVINAILDHKFESTYSRRFHATILSEYPFCDTTHNGTEKSLHANVVYTCLVDKDVTPYVDDNNENEFDFWQKN